MQFLLWFFFKELFSFHGLFINLKCLSITLKNNFKIQLNEIEQFNNFKSLKFLKLGLFNLTKLFYINLIDLEELILDNCINIYFTQDTCLNLKKIKIYGTITSDEDKISNKFPELEECILDLNDKNKKIYITKEIFDYKSLNKLKLLEADINDFIYLEPKFLEKLILKSAVIYSEEEMEYKIISKILSNKNLKEITAKLDVNFRELKNIPGVNNSVTKLEFLSDDFSDQAILVDDLLTKFPNLKSLSIDITCGGLYGMMMKEIDLKIKEDSKCKINDINLVLNGGGSNIQLSCQSFQKLEKFCLFMKSKDDKLKNIKTVFPIFDNNKCQEFSSLKDFKFQYYDTDGLSLDIIKNVFNNIDSMNNLTTFVFCCYISGKDIEEKFYYEFIRKILLKKLKEVVIKFITNESINKNNYSVKELKEIAPEINCVNLNNVHIQKL